MMSRILLALLEFMFMATSVCAMASRSDITALSGNEDRPDFMPRMVEIPGGTFVMGTAEPDKYGMDEAPAHSVSLASFFMSACEITNAQYEAFDPAHRALRGRGGFSAGDDEAVVNVSWNDAVRYCRWLSERSGRNFRLPTEAEWEYACRAGSAGDYHTGDVLPEAMHKHQQTERNLVPVDLTVGRDVPNVFGLHDMHGNVEEWCMDWYGPYQRGNAVNPQGPQNGWFKVTRGGSHNTPVYFLRSANRSAATPDDAHSQIGFRVVCDAVCRASVMPQPFFMEPVPFVIDPLYNHNHQPAVTYCDNGDLLAIWFSTDAESGREMVVMSSRFHPGADSWEKASLFFKVPDRNMTGASLLHLPDGTLLHMNGVGNSGDWQNLALCRRFSFDNGYTWTRPELVERDHTVRHQVIAGPIVLSDGTLAQCCDAGAGGEDGTALHVSRDWGVSWTDCGGTIAGIHAGIVQLKDGSLMALGRGNNIGGYMPKSISRDMGATWEYSATEFPGIGSGQRLVLLRLHEGPIMLASFGSAGIFVCLSDDEGESWSAPKLLSDGVRRELDGGAFTKEFVMDASHAEPKGYFCAVQTPDGTIHLLSSRLHYRFNLAWIRQ